MNFFKEALQIDKALLLSVRYVSVALALFFGIALTDVSATDPVVMRFAVLGDAEPKPEPIFPGVEAAVADINALSAAGRLDFVIGVGDIAHKATIVQYENVTPILKALKAPFYPIMGNEEHHDTEQLFIKYANQWSESRDPIDSTKYVLETDRLALVLASPDHGRDFSQEGVAWMLETIRRLAPKPVFLVVHAAQVGVYAEKPDKGVTNEQFLEVIAQPNVAAVISGDLHMDMDRTVHSKKLGHVHYLHIPALERTKVPDDSRHTPMFRVFSIHEDGEVEVDTYEVGVGAPLDRHAYHFSLPSR